MKVDLENLTVKQLRQAAAMLGGCTSPQPAMNAHEAQDFAPGQKVIVRSRDAGCWFGTLEKLDAKACAVTLTGARQMWYWKAARGITLMDCAEFGVEPTKCKFSVGKRRATMLNACAIIEVSAEAAQTMEAAYAG